MGHIELSFSMKPNITYMFLKAKMNLLMNLTPFTLKYETNEIG